MIRFIDVYDAEEQCNTGQRFYAKKMFNAGMKRAAEKVFDEQLCINPEYVAEAIRKEIDK